MVRAETPPSGLSGPKFFTESFESVIPHVIEAVEITHTLAPLGTAPALVSDTGAYIASAS